MTRCDEMLRMMRYTYLLIFLSTIAVPSNGWVPRSPGTETRTLKLHSLHLPIDVSSSFEAALECSEVIDVRSPSEFELDHFPGSINIPVLSDSERHTIGCLYKENSFLAKKKGAALVARNIAHHLDHHLSEKPGSFKPLVYCWRGGSRSASMAVTLAQVGWRVCLLEGGYKRFRQEVVAINDAVPPTLNFRVLAGLTGVGKTALLMHLRAHGHQVVDLEGLANHRGSTLGASGLGAQPSQKMFESKLAVALKSFDPARPVWIEAESSKVGDLAVPCALWKSMCAAPRLFVTLPLKVRVARILDDYSYWVENPKELKVVLERLRRRHGTQTLDRWNSLIDAGRWPSFVESLLLKHYDGLYQHKEAKHANTSVATVHLLDFSAEQLKVFVETAVECSPV